MTPHTEVTADVATRQAIERFNDAVNRRDVDAVVAAMTEDCVFDCTQPPDGERYHGADQMRAFLVRLFATARERHFDVEELITAGDRATVRCFHHWVDTGGNPGHVRGVDVVRVQTARSRRSWRTSRADTGGQHDQDRNAAPNQSTATTGSSPTTQASWPLGRVVTSPGPAVKSWRAAGLPVAAPGQPSRPRPPGPCDDLCG